MALYQAQLSGDGGVLRKDQCSTPLDGYEMADESREKEMVQCIQDKYDCTKCYDIQQASWQGDYRKWCPPYRDHQR